VLTPDRLKFDSVAKLPDYPDHSDRAHSFRLFAHRRAALESLAGTRTMVMVRGQLYEKPAGKKNADPSAPLKLVILEVQKKE